MPRRSPMRWLFGIAGVSLSLFLLVTANASAYPGLAKVTERQVLPGQTLRTIYGSAQVFTYKLAPVNHVGYIHIELLYGYPDYDCYVYLVDESGTVVSTSDGVSTETQGFASSWAGKEVVDFYVEEVADQSLNEAGDDLTGDTYYVVVQAWADVSRFELRGYFPRIAFDPVGANDVASVWNWYREIVHYPQHGRRQIFGAPYDAAFDLTPTSSGTAYLQLRAPWNAGATVVNDGAGGTAAPWQPLPDYLDPSRQRPNFDQYLYPRDWSAEGAIWDQDWYGDSHRLGVSTHGGLPPIVMAPDPSWTRALSQAFRIEPEGLRPPGTKWHYVPMVWLASSDSAGGASAPPVEGMATIGYLATLLFPQNLWLDRSAVEVFNDTIRLSGRLSCAPASVTPGADGEVDWAPVGTRVTVQRRGGATWTKAGTGAVVGEGGRWTATVPARSGVYRATWQGSAIETVSVKVRTWAETVAGSGLYDWGAWALVDLRAADQQLFAGAPAVRLVALDATGGGVTLAAPTETYDHDGNGSTAPVPWPGIRLDRDRPACTISLTGRQPIEVALASVRRVREYSLHKSVSIRYNGRNHAQLPSDRP